MDEFLVNRRQALRGLASGAIGTVALAGWADALIAHSAQQAHAHAAHAALAAQDWTPDVLSPQQDRMVVFLTELIIPETDTPGAKGAHVNRFVDHVLASGPPPVREQFVKGLAWAEARSRALFAAGLLEATPAQGTELLTRLAAEGNPEGEEQIGIDFFRALKAMTINGYYTTEIGLRQELGDPGQLFLLQFPGCDHPEHQG